MTGEGISFLAMTGEGISFLAMTGEGSVPSHPFGTSIAMTIKGIPLIAMTNSKGFMIYLFQIHCIIEDYKF
jgi:hypothetical protein